MQAEDLTPMAKLDPGGDFWALIAPYTGPVSAVRHAERGYSSDVTAIVECTAGPVFLKAVREPSPHTSSLEREAQINPYVRSVSPVLQWSLHQDGWIVLAFDVAVGTYADFEPGSPDLPAVVDAVNAIGAIDCPDVARDWPETRWDPFTGQASRFAGNTLLYTDINPDNFLITSSGVSIVDWSWPTRGAGFIDPACLVVQLIAAGHQADEAEGWAQRCTAWRSADPEAINTFATATVRMYQHFEQRDPAPWRKAMTIAATTWAAYRGISEPEAL
jgi:hypothetical protein